MLELARHPEQIQKLRDELAPYMPDPDADVSYQDVATLVHLNAIIYETLRMYPPVPTALLRQTPPEGIEIEGVYIPGNMTVWCPQYAIGRSKEDTHTQALRLDLLLLLMLTFIAEEEIYTHASAFIPERWYLYPEMIKEKSAWAPFSVGTSESTASCHILLPSLPSSSDFFRTGPYGCIGRPLALMNIRMTVARVVMMFDISFSPADDDNGRTFEARTREHFTLCPAELGICFEKRKLVGK